MKTAIYIEDGVTQLVLTPETPWEKAVLSKLGEETAEVTILRGSFYECQGGWTRYSQVQSNDQSLMLRIKHGVTT